MWQVEINKHIVVIDSEGKIIECKNELRNRRNEE